MALVGEFIVRGDRRVLARVCLLLGEQTPMGGEDEIGLSFSSAGN